MGGVRWPGDLFDHVLERQSIYRCQNRPASRIQACPGNALTLGRFPCRSTLSRNLAPSTDKARAKGAGRQKVGVGVMKDKELKLEETKASHTLGGAIKYT